MPMVMVAGIAFRAIFLKRLLERASIRVVETWPTGVFQQMLSASASAPPRLDTATRARLLLGRVDDPHEQLQQSDLPLDALDAIAAALSAWAYAIGQFQSIGDDAWADEGRIILPCRQP